MTVEGVESESFKMSQEATTRTSSVMAVHSESHKLSILSKFNKLRKKDLLCDITLIVEEVQFKAHKALLAASSEYFSLMFTAGDKTTSQSTFRLEGLTADVFGSVLEFIYNARVSVEQSDMEQLLDTARLMQIHDFVKVLSELTNSDAKNIGEEGVKAKVPNLSKRKRGRPKKNVLVSEEGQGESPEEMQEREVEFEDGLTDAQATDDADYNPEGSSSRQSKRKIRPPVKYANYKVSSNTAESKEPAKRGRKRKYPDAEAPCEECGKVFKNPLLLKIHQRTHTGEKPFGCSVCGKCFTQKHTLLVHQRIHTGEKPFVCSICRKALSTKNSLQEHMSLHEGEKSFRCDKCDKSFTQKRQLKSHYKVHTGKSLPECAQCHHTFLDTAQLKKHLRTHTGEKPFTCEICGKCFTAKSTLHTHIRIHRGEKPYHCNICNKSFSDPSARRRHVASHSAKKSFTCSFCSLSFTRADNLKTHTKTHNKERAAPAEDPAAAAETEAAAAAAGAGQEEVRNILQLQPYPLPSSSSSEQEIQLVVTADVENINFVPGQNQEISIITTEGETAGSAHSRLTLVTQATGNVQNVALVSQGGGMDQNTHIQTISVLDGAVTQQPEQMHVITLSKEAMEQLQAHHSPPQPLQVPQRGVQQLQEAAGREQHSQAIHISSQSSQPISISQTSQQISSHHIQGPTFQIQAGTVSYLYTTGIHES